MCCNRDYGCVLATVISIFLGVIIGVLFFFALIPTIIPAIWIAFGLSILTLIGLVTLSSADIERGNQCMCIYGKCLLAGIFGSLITSIIALVITLTVGAVFGAIVIAIWGFFFTLLLIALIMLVKCLIEANCRFRE